MRVAVGICEYILRQRIEDVVQEEGELKTKIVAPGKVKKGTARQDKAGGCVHLKLARAFPLGVVARKCGR